MKKAIFTTKAQNETYTLGGVKSLEQAWSLVEWAANRNGWNVIDVFVKLA